MTKQLTVTAKNMLFSKQLLFLSIRFMIILAILLTLISVFGSNVWRFLAPWFSAAILLLVNLFYILEGRDACEHLPNYHKAQNPLMEYHQLRDILEVQPGPSSQILLKKIVITRRLAIFSIIYYMIHWLIMWCLNA